MGALQWHHVHSSKVGRHAGTQPQHTTTPPCNGTTSTPPKLAVTLPPNHSTQQRHPAMAPRPLPQSWTSTPLHPHYNGNVQWHPAMAPRPLHPAMAPWCHVQSAKVVRRPAPLLEVRTPIAIAIWGKIITKHHPVV